MNVLYIYDGGVEERRGEERKGEERNGEGGLNGCTVFDIYALLFIFSL